jgi:lysophospholipase L1-like esterase
MAKINDMKIISKSIQTLLMVLLFHTAGLAQEPSSQKLDPNMALKKADADGIVWFDPREEPFELSGFEWIKEDSLYRRLPLNPDWEIRDAVDQLANHTAGGQLRFRTNSPRIMVKVELRERSGMYHMPATGQSGFDLYLKEDMDQKYFKTTRFSADSISYQVELYSTDENKVRTFTLNFPLYNGVNSVLVGLQQGSLVEAPPSFSRTGKIVIYGTSITQGGCVARPGMVYSNILSRKLDVQFVNLGFSGNGRGEPALANLINEIEDKRMLILDYEANASKTIVNTLEPFIDILREKHQDLPILIVSKIRYAREIKGSSAYNRLLSNRDFQENLVDERRTAGDTNIYFLDGSDILGDDYDECTVDGVHPTDLGSIRIAQALQPVLEGILSRK